MLAIFEPVPLGLLDLVIGIGPRERVVLRRRALPRLEDQPNHRGLVAVLGPQSAGQSEAVGVARSGEPPETVLDELFGRREHRKVTPRASCTDWSCWLLRPVADIRAQFASLWLSPSVADVREQPCGSDG